MYFAIFNGLYRTSSRRIGYLRSLNYIRVIPPFSADEGKSMKGLQNFPKFLSSVTRFDSQPAVVKGKPWGRLALKKFLENRRDKNNTTKEIYHETKIEDPGDEVVSKVYACRYMDEVYFGICGSEEVAYRVKSEVLNYLQGYLHLNVEGELKLIPSEKKGSAIRVMGTIVGQAGGDSPHAITYHRMKVHERHVKEYLSREIASTRALMKIPESKTQPIIITQVLASFEDIQMRLLHHRVATSEGLPRDCTTIITINDEIIIDWFATIARQWIRWYCKCDNFNDIKGFICNLLRMSCIYTLCNKHRLSGRRIRLKFGDKLNSRNENENENESSICAK